MQFSLSFKKQNEDVIVTHNVTCALSRQIILQFGLKYNKVAMVARKKYKKTCSQQCFRSFSICLSFHTNFLRTSWTTASNIRHTHGSQTRIVPAQNPSCMMLQNNISKQLHIVIEPTTE